MRPPRGKKPSERELMGRLRGLRRVGGGFANSKAIKGAQL